MKNLLIGFVLVAATVQCVQCIFFDNISLLNLPKYVSGQEKMPFQGRVAMMPILRWGARHYAPNIAAMPPGAKWGMEPPTAEKLASYKASLYSLLFILALCTRHGIRNGREFWWLCPALALLSFYIGYGARADQNYWYPYDLPHAALFTAACLFLLEGKWLLMAAFFLADLPMRETSLYLVPCLLAVGWVQEKRGKAVLFASGMTAAWLADHVAIARHFRANPSDVGLHYQHFGLMFHNRRYWPQVLSIMGYLWLPLALGWRFLSRQQLALIAGAVPGLLTTAVFGIWYETRVWGEWNALAACLVFSALAASIQLRDRQHGLVNSETQERAQSRESVRAEWARPRRTA